MGGMLDARREAGMTRFFFIQDKDPRYSSFCLKVYPGRTQLNSLVTPLKTKEIKPEDYDPPHPCMRERARETGERQTRGNGE